MVFTSRTIKKAKPVPALAGDESALTLIGFAKNDVLYYGSRSTNSSRFEDRLFGDRHYKLDFDSPDDLVQKIKEHAQKHGKIKYLKIMSHGLPGLIYTTEATTSPTTPGDKDFSYTSEPGWVSAAWFSENMENIQKITQDAFAEDVRIIIYSCLTGTNFDDFTSHEEKKVGDQLLDTMAEAMLVNGGRIDASRRVLVGINTVFWESFVGRVQGLNRRKECPCDCSPC